ncbi:10987_t:CDS:2 [Entrophospora sp. SA101]|nr:10987_t:CDS:2 [Entrophospora sp. SA101]
MVKKRINIPNLIHRSNSIFHQKPVKFPDLENTMNFWISRVSAQDTKYNPKNAALF